MTPEEHNRIHALAYGKGLFDGLNKAAGIAEANGVIELAVRFRTEAYKVKKRAEKKEFARGAVNKIQAGEK